MNQKGYSIISAITGLMLGAIILAGVMTLMVDVYDIKTTHFVKGDIDTLHSSSLQTIRNISRVREIIGMTPGGPLEKCFRRQGTNCQSYASAGLLPFDNASLKLNGRMNSNGSCANTLDPACNIQRSVSYRIVCSDSRSCEGVEISAETSYLNAAQINGGIIHTQNQNPLQTQVLSVSQNIKQGGKFLNGQGGVTVIELPVVDNLTVQGASPTTAKDRPIQSRSSVIQIPGGLLVSRESVDMSCASSGLLTNINYRKLDGVCTNIPSATSSPNGEPLNSFGPAVGGNVWQTTLANNSCGSTGFAAIGMYTNQASCNALPPPPTPTNCVGIWTPCSAPCGGGMQTHVVTTQPKNGGAACAYANGAVRACNTQSCAPPVNCIGSWSSCSKTCGGGTQKFTITTPAQNGGAQCSWSQGATQACNALPCSASNCVGNWTSCSVPCGGGIQHFVVSIPAQNGGSCPFTNGQAQQCNMQACSAPSAKVDCVGTWSACNPSTGVMTYQVTTAAQNGGLSCPYANGQTSNVGCAVAPPPPVAVNCQGYWSSCNQATGTMDYIVTQQPQNGGAACPSPTTQQCARSCSSIHLVDVYNNPMYIQCSSGNPSVVNFSVGGTYGGGFSWTGGNSNSQFGPFNFSLSVGGSFKAMMSKGVQTGTVTSLSYCSVTVSFGGGLKGQSTVNFCN